MSRILALPIVSVWAAFAVGCQQDIPLAISPPAPDLAFAFVPKPSPYEGPHYEGAVACTDEALEPNDGSGTAVDVRPLGPAVDGPALRLASLAITPCPASSGPGDRDYYAIEATQRVWTRVELSYQVAYGDLDLGLFDAGQVLVTGDGGTTDDACVAAEIDAGSYYIGVAGATESDRNQYQLGITFTSSPIGCP